MHNIHIMHNPHTDTHTHACTHTLAHTHTGAHAHSTHTHTHTPCIDIDIDTDTDTETVIQIARLSGASTLIKSNVSRVRFSFKSVARFPKYQGFDARFNRVLF